MADLPLLGPDDIKQKARELFAQREPARADAARRFFAVYGTGSEDEIEVDDLGTLRIEPVRSELDLRAKLPPLGARGPLTAYLVPWLGSMPVDLAGRFVRSGHVVSIGQSERLKVLFKAVEVAPGLEPLTLARYLLRPDNPTSSYGATMGHLTEELLWARWLAVDWGLEGDGTVARDALLAWAAYSGRGSLFTRAMEHEAAAGVREALLRHLGRVGPLGPLAWRLWEAGQGADLLAFGVICEAIAQSGREQDIAVRVWIRLTLKSRLGVADDQAGVVTDQLAESTSLALRLLQHARGEHAESRQKLAREIVARADSWLDSDIRDAVAGSRRLPTAWRLRLGALGQALTEGAAKPTAEAAAQAETLRRDLEQHEAFRDSNALEAKRAEMAVRLLGWLAAPRDRLEPHGLAPHADAETLSQWYAEDGGFVDWARREARGSDQGPFAVGVKAVLDRVDAARIGLDRRFGVALAAWHGAQRPAHRVLPIDEALRRLAVPFLQERPDRRLLVLLMDGMAWAQAVQLLQSMHEAHPAPWGPLAWHRLPAHRVGQGRYPAVLANLPPTAPPPRPRWSSLPTSGAAS